MDDFDLDTFDFGTKDKKDYFKDKDGKFLDSFSVDSEPDLKKGVVNIQNSLMIFLANISGFRIDPINSSDKKITMKYAGTHVGSSEDIDNIATALQPFAQNPNIIKTFDREEMSFQKWEILSALNASFLVSSGIPLNKYSLLNKNIKNFIKTTFSITKGSRDLMEHQFRRDSEPYEDKSKGF